MCNPKVEKRGRRGSKGMLGAHCVPMPPGQTGQHLVCRRLSLRLGLTCQAAATWTTHRYLWHVGCIKDAAAATQPVGSTVPTTSVHARACDNALSPSIELFAAAEIPVGSREV